MELSNQFKQKFFIKQKLKMLLDIWRVENIWERYDEVLTIYIYIYIYIYKTASDIKFFCKSIYKYL